MNDMNRMGTQLSLEGKGFRAEFQFQQAANSAEHFDATVRLILSASVAGACIESVASFLSIAEFGRLSDYLDNHLLSLRKGARLDTGPFVPMELGFQLEALDGDVDADGEGELSLRFMANVGLDPDEETRVYAGVEGAIDAAKLAEFAAHLRSLVAGIRSPRVEGAA